MRCLGSLFDLMIRLEKKNKTSAFSLVANFWIRLAVITDLPLPGIPLIHKTLVSWELCHFSYCSVRNSQSPVPETRTVRCLSYSLPLDRKSVGDNHDRILSTTSGGTVGISLNFLCKKQREPSHLEVQLPQAAHRLLP